MHHPGHLLATAALIASGTAASAVPLRVDVDQLMNDKVALHGITVATASSQMKFGKWSVSLSQSFLQDNVLSMSRAGERLLLPDIYQKTRRGFRDLTLSAGRSYSLGKRLRFDLTMGSSLPMGGTFGTSRLDQSVDAMLSTERGPTTLWAGVTQHLRMGGLAQTRHNLTEYYAGLTHDFSDDTSLKAIYYHAQSELLQARSTTSLALSLNHDLKDVGNVGVNASRTTDWTGDDKRASLSLKVDKLPF